MKIIYNPVFENELLQIINHIAEDKPNASIKYNAPKNQDNFQKDLISY